MARSAAAMSAATGSSRSSSSRRWARRSWTSAVSSRRRAAPSSRVASTAPTLTRSPTATSTEATTPAPAKLRVALFAAAAVPESAAVVVRRAETAGSCCGSAIEHFVFGLGEVPDQDGDDGDGEQGDEQQPAARSAATTDQSIDVDLLRAHIDASSGGRWGTGPQAVRTLDSKGQRDVRPVLRPE